MSPDMRMNFSFDWDAIPSFNGLISPTEGFLKQYYHPMIFPPIRRKLFDSLEFLNEPNQEETEPFKPLLANTSTPDSSPEPKLRSKTLSKRKRDEPLDDKENQPQFKIRKLPRKLINDNLDDLFEIVSKPNNS